MITILHPGNTLAGHIVVAVSSAGKQLWYTGAASRCMNPIRWALSSTVAYRRH